MSSETFRDAWGIPHLRADTPDELAFLQGYNAATDRSWQIEMEAPVWAGSNAWAATGIRTASGSPLIAGDPHRLMERDIYAFLDNLETHHAYVMSVEDKPVGIFQSYEPLEDPVGEAYEARAEDTGMHLLLAPATRPVRNFTPVLVAGLARFLLSDPAKDRVVAEPDARNHKAIQRFQGCGFAPGAKVQLAEKEAQLVFLTRAAFESQAS